MRWSPLPTTPQPGPALPQHGLRMLAIAQRGKHDLGWDADDVKTVWRAERHPAGGAFDLGALGGTRTPDLLIRRSGQVVQDRPSPVVGWADIPELSTCVGRRPAAWLQSWLQSRWNGADPRPSAFQAGHNPRWHESCECYALLAVAAVSRCLLLLLSPLLSAAGDGQPGGRDLCPLRSGCRVWCGGPVFIGAEVRLDVGFNAAQARLANLARDGLLRRASDDAYRELGSGLARVGPLGAAPGISKLIVVRFSDLSVHEDFAVGAMRWEAPGPGGALFPALDADIKLTRAGDESTVLAVSGVYRPPLGGLGTGLDRMVMRRIAQATIRTFAHRIGAAITDPAASPEVAGTGLLADWPQWPEPEGL
jgi:hypothetical protein